MTGGEHDGPLLEVRGLRVAYGSVTAVEGADLVVQRGQRVAIVGESGSGKTSLGNAIGGFIDPLAGHVTADALLLEGRPLERTFEVGMQERIPRRTPGLSMVFQDAMSSLDPVWTIGSQLTAVLRGVSAMSKKQARSEAVAWLREVGIAEPERVMHDRPHQLSGGMRQRVMMAIALSSKPSLLIADEPTSALDASLAVVAMELMVDLARREGTAVLMVTHDIELCRRFTDVVVVMHRGRIVETLASADLDRAQHPYTRGLVQCVPTLASAGLEVLPTLESVAGAEEAA
ncbi:peptide/nickel transport system ATP-binding protein/peptide/nickel transport system ATP-binding protein [Rathayibacter oskolensis]|uniref:Peptide/nickel transport system ATP-binding protein/peptide/nickel transport system ATP-binding protein n=1 Tax=Rathayibacter oskolensis TaxID=1891671 RepID=A0A1X7NZG4_9MICO|nr:ABC transporter ATP-binding protein [Rathayibacter oskolensis]SMH43210.1 peptide/nickel transport system ATP-binding protein/peptide/nickel transport system ATP-binding protein [Rathayibacter oskolensis]